MSKEENKEVWICASCGHEVDNGEHICPSTHVSEAKECDCGCHTSPTSNAEMKKNGCDLCYWNSEYNPRHPRPSEPSESTPPTTREEDSWEKRFDERFVWEMIFPPEERPIKTLHPRLVEERHLNELKDFIRAEIAHREAQARKDAIYDITPPTTREEDSWLEIKAAYDIWKEQGRTDEQRWAVINFLTGAGFKGISAEIAHREAQARNEAIIELVDEREEDIKHATRQAERERIVKIIKEMPDVDENSISHYGFKKNILARLSEDATADENTEHTPKATE